MECNRYKFVKISHFSLKLAIEIHSPIGLCFYQMAKHLRIRDKLLLGLAVCGDSFFELTKSSYISEKQALGVLPPDYKMSNFTGGVFRMLKTGYIEKIIKSGEPYLRLTGGGKRALVRDFPMLKLKLKKWDGGWRMVFYDIAELNRHVRKSLQRKLKELGFGQLQKSVYISPLDVADDIREFIESKDLKDLVFVAIAKRFFGDDKDLAAKVWHLDKLNERYANFLLDLEDFLTGKRGLIFAELYKGFETILIGDPFLPKELLPDWWLGDRVLQKMKELLRKPKI